jgi:hypothetical protein
MALIKIQLVPNHHSGNFFFFDDPVINNLVLFQKCKTISKILTIIISSKYSKDIKSNKCRSRQKR